MRNRVFRAIVAFIVSISIITSSFAQETGSWRIVGRGEPGSTNYIVPPDICNRNFATYGDLAGCLNQGGENPGLWTTTSSAARVVFSTSYTTPTATESSTSVAAADRLDGDIYYKPAIPGNANPSSGLTIYLESSTGTRINWVFSRYQAGNINTVKAKAMEPTNSGTASNDELYEYRTTTASYGVYWLYAYNSGIPPDEEDDVCEVPLAERDETSAYPASYSAVTWLPISSVPNSERKIRYQFGPEGTIDCEWAISVQFPANPYTVNINGQDISMILSYITTTGVFLEEGQGETAVASEHITLKDVLTGYLPGDVANGSSVNVNAGKMMSELAPAEQWDAICSQAGTVACAQMGSQIVQTIKIDDCTTKIYWHDGNRSSTGECIGAYDRDWPDPQEPYSPDKAWKWEPGSTPATPKDISDGKMTAISDTTGKPVTAESKVTQGSIVYYPATAGGGTSQDNQGDPNGVEPPTAPPDDGDGTPEGLTNGNGWYESRFPGGIGEVWDGFQGEIMGTGLGQSLQSYTIQGQASTTGDMCWAFDMTAFDLGNPELCFPEVTINLVKTMLFIGTIMYCRSLVFGG